MAFKSTEILKKRLDDSRASASQEERKVLALETIAECLIDIRRALRDKK